MAVDLNNVGPTSDRINAATSTKQLAAIRIDVETAEYICIAQKGWEAADVCNLVADALYLAIGEKAKTLPAVLGGSPITITVGDRQARAPVRRAALGAASPTQTLVGLAFLSVGAYFLWRYTQS